MLGAMRSFTTAYLPHDHPILQNPQEKRSLQVVMAVGVAQSILLTIRGAMLISTTPKIGLIVFANGLLFAIAVGVVIAFKAKGYRAMALGMIAVAASVNYFNSYLSNLFPPAGLPFAAVIIVALHFLFNRWISLAGLVIQTLIFVPFLFRPEIQYSSPEDRHFWHSRFYVNAAIALVMVWIVCEAYRSVRDQVERHLNRLQADMARDVSLAGRIQQDLLPSNNERGPYSWHGVMQTMSPVGGDYYDVLDIRGHIWCAMGDVTGHGLQAALLGMLARTSMHQLLRDGQVQDPGRVLSLMNFSFARTVRELRDRSFMTFVLLRLDADGTVVYAGSHLRILVYRPAEDRMDLYQTRGPWLGLQDGDQRVPFEEQTFKLERGDTILLYSDGATEINDPFGNPLGVEGLVRIFGEALAQTESTEALTEHIVTGIKKIASKNAFDDDLSLLTIRRDF